MWHWQLVMVFALLISISTSSMWSDEFEVTKICFHITGPPNSDLRCANYCKENGKPGGRCVKKRCVCNKKQNEDDDDDGKQGGKPWQPQVPSFLKPNFNIKCTKESTICQLHCNSEEKSKGICVDGRCACSTL